MRISYSDIELPPARAVPKVPPSCAGLQKYNSNRATLRRSKIVGEGERRPHQHEKFRKNRHNTPTNVTLATRVETSPAASSSLAAPRRQPESGHWHD